MNSTDKAEQKKKKPEVEMRLGQSTLKTRKKESVYVSFSQETNRNIKKKTGIAGCGMFIASQTEAKGLSSARAELKHFEWKSFLHS